MGHLIPVFIRLPASSSLKWPTILITVIYIIAFTIIIERISIHTHTRTHADYSTGL